jgi:hypothetical protein
VDFGRIPAIRRGPGFTLVSFAQHPITGQKDTASIPCAVSCSGQVPSRGNPTLSLVSGCQPTQKSRLSGLLLEFAGKNRLKVDFLGFYVRSATNSWRPAWTKNTDMSDYTTKKKINHEIEAPVRRTRRTKDTQILPAVFDFCACAVNFFLPCFLHVLSFSLIRYYHSCQRQSLLVYFK